MDDDELRAALQTETQDESQYIQHSGTTLVSGYDLIKKPKFKHVSTFLPLYTLEKQEKEDSISTPFLPIKYNGQIMHIRKSTAVWLFNKGERLSSDHLLESEILNLSIQWQQKINRHQRNSMFLISSALETYVHFTLKTN